MKILKNSFVFVLIFTITCSSIYPSSIVNAFRSCTFGSFLSTLVNVGLISSEIATGFDDYNSYNDMLARLKAKIDSKYTLPDSSTYESISSPSDLVKKGLSRSSSDKLYNAYKNFSVQTEDNYDPLSISKIVTENLNEYSEFLSLSGVRVLADYASTTNMVSNDFILGPFSSKHFAGNLSTFDLTCFGSLDMLNKKTSKTSVNSDIIKANANTFNQFVSAVHQFNYEHMYLVIYEHRYMLQQSVIYSSALSAHIANSVQNIVNHDNYISALPQMYFIGTNGTLDYKISPLSYISSYTFDVSIIPSSEYVVFYPTLKSYLNYPTSTSDNLLRAAASKPINFVSFLEGLDSYESIVNTFKVFPIELDSITPEFKVSILPFSIPFSNMDALVSSIDLPIDSVIPNVVGGLEMTDGSLDDTILKNPVVSGVIDGVITPDYVVDIDSDEIVSAIDDLGNNLLKNDKDNSIDFDPLKVSFADVFPFCIPFDLYNIAKSLVAEKVAPRFELDLAQYSSVFAEADPIVFDFSDPIFTNLITVVRGCLLLSFVVALALKTRDIIRG